MKILLLLIIKLAINELRSIEILNGKLKTIDSQQRRNSLCVVAIAWLLDRGWYADVTATLRLDLVNHTYNKLRHRFLVAWLTRP